MSAPIAKDQFTFALPNLSYVDASLEEANFRAPALPGKPRGLRALVAAFAAWREKRAALNELQMLTDRELADIGLSRADLPRVFDEKRNRDLLDRALV
jgi:uncharacterized protein YjiS (DUF1127 family)